MLLLWIGIFLPVTEYQVSHLGGIGSLISVTFGDDDSASDERAQTDKATNNSDRYTASVGIDLSDFTLVIGPLELALRSEPLPERRISEGFASRDLPPEERPPIGVAA